MTRQSLTILLVEDNPAVIALTRETIADGAAGGVSVRLNAARDGVEAVDLLKAARDGRGDLPSLIILDLNLPLKDGREVLEDIKADPELRKIPVVVFTTSNTPEDVADVYGRYANSFVTKPVDLEHYAATVKSISDYWFNTVTLPA